MVVEGKEVKDDPLNISSRRDRKYLLSPRDGDGS